MLHGDYGRKWLCRGRRISRHGRRGHLRRWRTGIRRRRAQRQDRRGGLCRRWFGGFDWHRLSGCGWLNHSRRRRSQRSRSQRSRSQRRGRRDGWLRHCDRCRSEHDAQIWHLDPSNLPGEGKARKSEFLTAKGQSEQQGMEQQGKQQRQRESPAMVALATNRRLAGAARLPGRRRRPSGWLFRCGVGPCGTQADTAIAVRVLRWIIMCCP